MSNLPEVVRVEGFRDELVKIALKGRLGDAAKRGAELLAGGKRKDVGLLARIGGKLNKTKVVGERTGTLSNLTSKDKALRLEAAKVLGAKTVAGTAGAAAVSSGVKKHRKTERKQLGRAYVSGARDMYSRMNY